MVLIMMGIGDLLYGTYANAILLGAVQKAGRDATIEANMTATAAIDDAVMTQVRRVAPAATYVSTRDNYANFSDVDKPEPFNDKAGGTVGKYDAGECFTDLNGNNKWDADLGRTGVGGANDVQQYKISVSYPRIFPVANLLGWGSTATISAETALKNQPYAEQSARAAKSICP